MRRTHSVFSPPEDLQEPLMRYMSFAKFVAMLESEALYFARVDRLQDDPFEGTISPAAVRAWHRFVADQGLPAEMADHAKAMSQFRRHTFVNCWYRGDCESPLMWNQYGRASNEAVAVRTNFERLTGALPDHVYAGVVHYVDFDEFAISLTNSMWPFVFKRKQFEGERELRALVQRLPFESDGSIRLSLAPSDDGLLIKVPLNQLIEAVCLPPGSPKWFAELVSSLMSRHEVQAPIRPSALDEQPLL